MSRLLPRSDSHAPALLVDTPEQDQDTRGFSEIEALTRENFTALVAYLRHRFPVLADDAEDLAQDALIAVRPYIADAPQPRGYLFKTAKHLAIDTWKKKQRVALLPSTELDESDLCVYASTDPAPAAARMIDFEAFMRTLPASERKVAQCQYVYEMRPKEIAFALGVEVGTVKSWQNRIRKRARALYGCDEEGAVT